MQTLTIHTENATELRAVKTVLKAMKIKFEENLVAEESSPYDAKFVSMVKQGDKDIKAGKGTVVSLDKLKVLSK